MKRRLYVGGGASAACAIVGTWITVDLADIPFGTTFGLMLNISLLLLTLAFVLTGLALLHSKRSWVRWTGTVPLVVGAMVLVVGVAIQTDPRVLHFRGPPPSLTPEQWQEDARYLVESMTVRHADLYALVDSAEWTAATDSVVARISDLEEPAILMQLMRIAGLPRDGHTFPFIMAPCFDLHSFPIILYGFPEGWHVVRAARGLSDLIGSRLLAISGRPIDEIYETCPQLIAWENEQSRKEHFTYMVVMAEWLAYHGIISDTDEARFTFLKADGDTVSQTISSIAFWPFFLWSSVFPVENSEPPVFTAAREDPYTWRTLDGGKVLYIQFNQCVEPPDKPTATEFAHEIQEFLRDNPVGRCIIDLRNNDGGQRVYAELLTLVREHAKINTPGHLLVLIGRRTFSAAVMFATELQMQTEALLVGEPTGQGPIFYSRPRLFELPNSGLMFAISSFHNVSGLPFDSRKTIEPDIPVAYGIEDFLNGRDPVLSTALRYEAPPPLEISSGPAQRTAALGRYQCGGTLLLDVLENEGNLTARITDALPNTSVLFVTNLTRSSAKTFTTRLPGVTLRFRERDQRDPAACELDWMGQRIVFMKSEPGFELPFEHFGRRDVGKGCSMLLSDGEHFRALYPNLEAIMNRLGYQYLRSGETRDALLVFGANVALFPLSSNVYDSYGEALMVDDQIDSAIANYRRSLELNPRNKNASKVIQRLLEMKGG